MKPYESSGPITGVQRYTPRLRYLAEELSLVIQRYSSKMGPIEYVFSSDQISKGSSVFSQEAAVGSSDLPLDALRWA